MPVPIELGPSKNTTVPDGVEEPPATVAVNVTLCPTVDGFGVDGLGVDRVGVDRVGVDIGELQRVPERLLGQSSGCVAAPARRGQRPA